MAPVLEGKSIGSDPKNSAKRRAPHLENQESGSGPRYSSSTQGFNLLQISSPNWFLGNWTLDPLLKWALVPWLKTMNFLRLLLTNHGKGLVIIRLNQGL